MIFQTEAINLFLGRILILKTLITSIVYKINPTKRTQSQKKYLSWLIILFLVYNKTYREILS